MKKYKFTGESKKRGNRTLLRIVATRDFGSVKAGDIGGWIEKESNLSHEGNCWVYDNGAVYGNGRVYQTPYRSRKETIYLYWPYAKKYERSSCYAGSL